LYVLVSKFVLLNVLLGHKVHHQLNVRLNHFLNMDCVAFIVLLLLCEVGITH
jgi:hypothetical protein